MQAEHLLHTVRLQRAASAGELAGRDERQVTTAVDERAAARRELRDPTPPHPAVPDFVQVRTLTPSRALIRASQVMTTQGASDLPSVKP